MPNLRLIKDVDLLVLREKAQAHLASLNVQYFTILGHYEVKATALKDTSLPADERAHLRAYLAPIDAQLDALAGDLKTQRLFCVAIANEIANRAWLTTLDPRIVALLQAQRGMGDAGGAGEREGGGL